jgi:hypothetical protein
MRKIIVVTPVKNEEWILDRFLAVTSHFADHIIVADQQSTDASRSICARFAKVHLISNESPTYDEAHRQRLLLTEARRLVPGERFILALDADEILTADSLAANSWKLVQAAAPGSVFYFEKPDLLPGLAACRRHLAGFPLGYVDDGAEQSGQLIHSMRIPVRAGHVRVDVADIKFMHLALVRPQEYRARQRLYSMLERINGTKSLWQRLAYYSPAIYAGQLTRNAEAVPAGWLGPWLQHGIDLRSFQQTELNQYNREALKLFSQHGSSSFFYDDVWDADWAQLAESFARKEATSNSWPHIQRPGFHYDVFRCLLLLAIKSRKSQLWKRATSRGQKPTDGACAGTK